MVGSDLADENREIVKIHLCTRPGTRQTGAFFSECIRLNRREFCVALQCVPCSPWERDINPLTTRGTSHPAGPQPGGILYGCQMTFESIQAPIYR
jgi:hypothetical protein